MRTPVTGSSHRSSRATHVGSLPRATADRAASHPLSRMVGAMANPDQPDLFSDNPYAGDPTGEVPHPADTADRAVTNDRGPSPFTQGLNPDQLDAVVHTDGPLLVVAGAGSGKTRVLTHRIAHLIDQGVRPSSILAITFTNKAAAEMRERVAHLVGPVVKAMWVSHVPLGVRAHPAARRRGARLPAHVLDLRPGRRRAAHRLRHPRPRARLQAVHAARRARLHLALEERAHRPGAGGGRGDATSSPASTPTCTPSTRAGLHKAGAMDFDDLLLNVVRLFREHPDVLEHYRQRFEHILVDEYQDTNQAQNEIVLMLAGGHQNVCVVGDTDQCLPPGTLDQHARRPPIEQIEVGDLAGRRPGARVDVGKVTDVRAREASTARSSASSWRSSGRWTSEHVPRRFGTNGSAQQRRRRRDERRPARER